MGELLGGDIENVEMVATTIQIADGVLLELEAVDDEGRRSFRFCGRLVFIAFFGGFGVLRLGILED